MSPRRILIVLAISLLAQHRMEEIVTKNFLTLLDPAESPMLVLSYFEPIATVDAAEQEQLIGLWQTSWPGFSLRILNEAAAQEHGRFGEFANFLRKMPQITPVGYADQCFYRWLAFEKTAIELADRPLLIVDWDVFPLRAISAQDFDRYQAPTILGPDFQPACVFLPQAQVLSTIIEMLVQPTVPQSIGGRPHLNDNVVFAEHWSRYGGKVDPNALCYANRPNRESWLVHFNNDSVPLGERRVDFVRRIIG